MKQTYWVVQAVSDYREGWTTVAASRNYWSMLHDLNDRNAAEPERKHRLRQKRVLTHKG